MLYIINFKTYRQGTGINSIKLAHKIKEVKNKLGVNILAAPQFTDLQKVAEITPTIAQHVDPINYGSHTGSILPQALKEVGAEGSLINHSEKKLPLNKIELCIALLRSLKLKTICCTGDIKEAIEIAKFSPDYLAFEDPELIGSGKPISKYKPKTVERFVEVVKDINPKIVPLCGAGISNKEDVESARKLGIKGVLVASAIVKAKNQREALLNLIL